MTIRQVERGSLAERAGFAPGDRVLQINGEDVGDPIDLQVHSGEDLLRFSVEREGEQYEVEVGRVADEPLGLDVDDMTLRRCNNGCVFCFIHQMPPGLRRSLYFEDDDYRLSFLQGSYVTLTNVEERDIERIVSQRLSPQYLSVHATDPELRQRLLGRRRPTVDIRSRIAALAAGGIEMHTQVVLCPGWNDGEHLERTVRDLSEHFPAVRSVALVPVGLTRHRAQLAQLEAVSPARAEEYVAFAEARGEEFLERLGERFVYAADELFLRTGRGVPARQYYGVFPQIENGIGMVRSFLDTWEQGRSRLPRRLGVPLRIGLVTGALAPVVLRPMVAQLNDIRGLTADLLVVDNRFFGSGITVSGLLAGEDVAARLRGGDWDIVILPPNCINGDGLTLDGLSIPQLAERAGQAMTVGDYDLVACLTGVLAGGSRSDRGSARQLSELGYRAAGRPTDG